MMVTVELEDINKLITAAIGEAFQKFIGQLNGGQMTGPAAPTTIKVIPTIQHTGNPFLMNDAELECAEMLLPENDRPILRMRVMAARLDSKGNHASANNMRSRANKKEQQLNRVRA